MATTYFGTAAGLNGQTIATFNPGDQIEALVAFVVPADANPDSIELHELPFSTGAIVNFPK